MVSQYTVDPDGNGPAKPFTLVNPDLSEQSLRGNAVFRWEYRPGSVFYVAWTQSRLGDSAFGDLDFRATAWRSLAARPDNNFLVKTVGGCRDNSSALAAPLGRRREVS